MFEPRPRSRLRARTMPRPSASLFVIFLAIVYGYAVARYGGVLVDWSACLLGIGLVALLYGLLTPRFDLAPLEGWLRWPVLLLPGYVAFQLIPLPVSLVRALSPARAELLAALGPLVPAVAFAPLSVAPSATVRELMRVLGYSVVFLLVRQIAWRSPERPWLPASPIVAVASVEAALGLWQYATGDAGSYAHGTYVARDHYAGLLEMSLPFAAAYPFAIRGRPAWRACGAISLALLILLGILYSLSRTGFLVVLLSLFVMGVLALGTGLGKMKRRLGVGALAGLLVLGAVFLPPNRLIERFAEIASTEDVKAHVRLRVWKATLHLIADYPVFGCGMGGYESAFAKYNVSVPLFRVDYAHNDYLQLLAELGVVGFCIAMTLGFGILAKTVCAIPHRSGPRHRNLALACAGALAAILIHSLVDFNLYNPANGLLLAWISGISAGLAFPACPAAAPAWNALAIPQLAENRPAY